ncbi:hypothetical protein Goshw_029170 [Gossypium schwendimanii]|uniref:DUF4283 domain-containing protein n=1 Tax=Gossypium schwendimanii TaxID=34291 RepID=A0A7J9ML65_GOSSC|nr:hypothetical protein [Gossypium schwendimanii]
MAEDINAMLERLNFLEEEVFRLLCFTKEEVNFVAMKEGAIIVKFGCLEDRSRILNLMPWLFDKCLFAMMSFIKGKDIDTYEFNLSSFWLRVYNIPLEHWTEKLRWMSAML